MNTKTKFVSRRICFEGGGGCCEIIKKNQKDPQIRPIRGSDESKQLREQSKLMRESVGYRDAQQLKRKRNEGLRQANTFRDHDSFLALS